MFGLFCSLFKHIQSCISSSTYTIPLFHLEKAFLSSDRASARLNLASWMTSGVASLLKLASKVTKASPVEVTSVTLKVC